MTMKKSLCVSVACLALAAATSAQQPQQAPTGLKVGDKAPDFSLPGTDGKTYTLAGLKGKTVVLAWFPKAFTGG
jgi:thioredoxin-dependent peroxiredoxin